MHSKHIPCTCFTNDLVNCNGETCTHGYNLIICINDISAFDGDDGRSRHNDDGVMRLNGFVSALDMVST